MTGVLVCLLVGTLVTLLSARGGDSKSPPSINQVVVSALFLQGAAIVLVWRFVREHAITWSEGFGLRNAPARAVLLAAFAITVFLPMGWLLQHFSFSLLNYLDVEVTTQQAVQVLHNVGQGNALGLAAFALVTVVIAPLGEELLFRGVLYPTIKRAGFPKLALWGSSILFAAIHLNLMIFLPLLLLALILVWLYEQTDNLIAPLAAHALFNAINLVQFFINGAPAATPPVQQ